MIQKRNWLEILPSDLIWSIWSLWVVCTTVRPYLKIKVKPTQLAVHDRDPLHQRSCTAAYTHGQIKKHLSANATRDVVSKSSQTVRIKQIYTDVMLLLINRLLPCNVPVIREPCWLL